MKTSTLALTVLLVSTFFSAFAQNGIPNPEILYYKFNEVGTSVTNYATGPAAGPATATLMGTLSQGGSGQCDGALIGSGQASSTDYLNTNWTTNLGSTSWTISFWTNNIGSTSTLYYIFGDASANSFRCFTNGVAGAGNWLLRGGGITDVYANGGAPITGPSMTTFVYDQPNNQIKAYVNGVLVNTVAQTAISIVGTGPFKVMGYNTNVGMSAGGLLDEYRMYNRVLSESEILQLYIRNTSSVTSITSCGVNYQSPSGSQVWNSSGTYYDTIVNSYCGDSLMTINLSLLSPTYASINAEVCESFNSPSGNYTWNTSGVYTDTLINAAGCDSIVTVNLVVNYSSNATINESACYTYSSPSGLYNWTNSGVYYDTIATVLGCDSLLVINLTINENSTATQSVSTIDAYTWPVNGQTYTSSGQYVATIPNSFGCDSIITLDLILNFTGINEINPNTNKKLLTITDLNGKEMPFRKNTILLFIYDDGTVERVFEGE